MLHAEELPQSNYQMVISKLEQLLTAGIDRLYPRIRKQELVGFKHMGVHYELYADDHDVYLKCNGGLTPVDKFIDFHTHYPQIVTPF